MNATAQRKANHPDQHNRRANDIAADAIIARTAQRKLNAKEWERRAYIAWLAYDDELSANLYTQARLEYPEGYGGKGR